MNELQKQLRIARILKGLPQNKVAEIIGLTQSGYNMIESGKIQPKVKVAKSIGYLLGIDWTVFYENVAIDAEEIDKKVAEVM